MKRVLASAAAVAATLALAACGSSGGGNASTTSKPATTGTAVSVKSINGMNVLVDSQGKALYAAQQETGSKLLCTMNACTSFWKPLTTTSSKPTAGSGAGKIGTIKRPDGAMQVTVGGKPVYTFAEDSPGKLAGNGFSDQFGGQHFTWHAVLAGGKASSGSASSGQGQSGGGYTSPAAPSGGPNGY
jgi:predicted lipoprotein with Yx(FWY)xxD motif